MKDEAKSFPYTDRKDRPCALLFLSLFTNMHTYVAYLQNIVLDQYNQLNIDRFFCLETFGFFVSHRKSARVW